MKVDRPAPPGPPPARVLTVSYAGRLVPGWAAWNGWIARPGLPPVRAVTSSLPFITLDGEPATAFCDVADFAWVLLTRRADEMTVGLTVPGSAAAWAATPAGFGIGDACLNLKTVHRVREGSPLSGRVVSVLTSDFDGMARMFAPRDPVLQPWGNAPLRAAPAGRRPRPADPFDGIR